MELKERKRQEVERLKKLYQHNMNRKKERQERRLKQFFDAVKAKAEVLREQDVVNYMLEDDAFYEVEEEDKQEVDQAQPEFEDYGLSPSDREAVM